MNPNRRAAATALIAAGLLVAAAPAASAAPAAPAQVISGASALQEHLRKAVALEEARPDASAASCVTTGPVGFIQLD
ncbi:hypothetical protein ACFYPN_04435 [Streptomyces sp. NPDC005576]|uniref:hypothetical protein n=1 Tax=Streptomyces sp. NPDC005576 TaxID=3364726 RepID=UPI0036A708C9